MKYIRNSILTVAIGLGIQLGWASPLFDAPKISITYKLPNSSKLTTIVKNSYSIEGRVAERYLKREISEKFPQGISREDAISFGFTCGSTEPVSCSYAGSIEDEIVNISASRVNPNQKKREVQIRINFQDIKNINSLTYQKTEVPVK